VREIQADKGVNIVMHQGTGGVNANHGGDTVLASGDTILVIAPMDPLLALEAMNQPANEAPDAAAARGHHAPGR